MTVREANKQNTTISKKEIVRAKSTGEAGNEEQQLHSEKRKSQKNKEPRQTKQASKSKLKKIPNEFKRLANWQQLILDSEIEQQQQKRKVPIKTTVA